MSSWITLMIADFRLDEAVRAAERRRLIREARSADAGEGEAGVPAPVRIAGELLLRAGSRLVGPDRARAIVSR
ncbi:MAG TPA: hypothetical protein VEK76_11530 [Candidatus Binatia bacterium]|nr:hypothetical protein [Candidatus Binatia bacterium]